MERRYLYEAIERHLATLRQMVFLVGPRQVGKTTLAQSFLREVLPGINYFNWDAPDQRRSLLTQIFPGKVSLRGENQKIIVFDEIHKYPRWKNTLKGLFDTYQPEAHWIVTGSALLDVYRKGQDSLLGRQFSYHLSPFSLAELLPRDSKKTPEDLLVCDFDPPPKEAEGFLSALFRFGGFPEPLFRAEDSFLLRWRVSRLDRLIHQDLAATENLRNLPLVEQLMTLLPARVGSLLSLNSLREDLEVHFATVKHWMSLLERVFYGFYLTPYSKKATRLLKKEPKWYLWDWTEIEDAGARFENMVAVHLLKYVNYMNDLGLDQLSLHYVRDKEKREADFLICRKRKPLFLMECKLGLQEPASSLEELARLLEIPVAFQIAHETHEPKKLPRPDRKVYQVPAASFLRCLV